MPRRTREGRPVRRPRRGTTLVEALLAVLLAAFLAFVLYGIVRAFFGRRSKASLITATERAFTQKDLRIGLKKLMLRLREATEIITPVPGKTAKDIVFRDVLNQTIRLRLDPARREIVSERLEGGDYVRESKGFQLVTDSGDSAQIALPIRIGNCSNVSFTALSPSCAVVTISLASGHVESSLMTAVHLRNFRLAL